MAGVVMVVPHHVFAQVQPAQRTPVNITPQPSPSHFVMLDTTTPSPSITPEALATPDPNVTQKIQEKTDQDITETSGKKKEALIEVLETHPIERSWYNVLQVAIRRSIEQGLPANLIVLLLLFPVIASFIAFTRHVIGLSGFGVYTPAVLSVAFVSTGITNGILLFLVIMGAAMCTHRVVQKMKLQPLPRTAMLFWGVSIVILLALIASAYLRINALIATSIFPILIIILLTENFMETQLFSSKRATIRLTLETLFTAIACSVLIGNQFIQALVILHPELTLCSVALLNILIGKYAGLRLLERLRFQSIIE
jgi:hypothetical protein